MSTDLQRDAQLAATPEAAHASQTEARLKDLHTCLPGIIASFDPATQTAQVQPAIKRIFTERGAVNLPLCVDVPVAFPGGGGFFLTFPVAAGDECLLMFSERAIDRWHVAGGTQEPAEYRLHDLSDGIAIVGLNSQPNKLSALQMSGAELRDRARSTYIRLEAGTIHIKGNIVHEGSNTQTGNLTVTGNIGVTGGMTSTGDVVGAGTSLDGHTHGGVSAGGANTAPPN